MEQNKKTKKLNILYRVIPLVCSLVIILASMCPVKVNAADFYYDTFVTSSGQILGSSYFNMTFPSSYIRLTAYDLYAGSSITTNSGSFNIGFGYGQMLLRNSGTSEDPYYGYSGYFITRPFGSNYLRLSDVPLGSQLVYTYDHYLSIDYPSESNLPELYTVGTVTGYVAVRYYDSNRNNISTNRVSAKFNQSFKKSEDVYTIQLYLNENVTVTMNYPDNAVYFQVWAYVSFDGYWASGISPGFDLRVNKNVSQLLIADKNASPEIIDQMVDLNNKNQTIINQNQQMLDNQEAIKDSIYNVDSTIKDQTEQIMQGDADMVDKVGNSVNDFQQSDQKLNDLTDDLKVNQPSIDPEDVAVENIVDAAMGPIYTAPLMKLWESPIILTVLTVVLTLVMISFVFFGKKG